MLRRLLAAATAVTLLTGGLALLAGPADAGNKPFFVLTVSETNCSACQEPTHVLEQGETVKFQASIRPGDRRPYVVQERAGGTWRVIRRKRTDGGGYARFKVSHSQTGSYALRAIAKRYHGHRRMVSNTIAWKVFLKTTVSAAFSATSAPANSTIVVTGRFSPATARIVGVETHDLRYGTLRGWSQRSNPDGTFAISFPTKGPGYNRFAVDVAQTDTEAEAVLWLPTLHVT